MAPFYEALATRPLDRAGVETWLAEWSRLEELLTEAAATAMIAYTLDTDDREREPNHLRFSTEIVPRMDEESVRLARRLLDLGFERPDLATMLERFRTQIEVFREENIPLFAELEELGARYQKITGSMMVEWEGKAGDAAPAVTATCAILTARVREKAFRLSSAPFLGERSSSSRHCLPGCITCGTRSPGWWALLISATIPSVAKFRFDYTPQDLERFHRSVEVVVTPAVERIREATPGTAPRATDLKPWDTLVDPYGLLRTGPVRGSGGPDRGPPSGSSTGSIRSWDGEFAYLRARRAARPREPEGEGPRRVLKKLLRGQPFIFMNAVGVADDVNPRPRGGPRVPRFRRASSGAHLAARPVTRRRSWHR